MIAALNQHEKRAAAETYIDVERLIDKTVWRFIDRYGGEFDDLRADANYYFLKAYQCPTFDAKKSKWTTYLCNAVWNGLIDCHCHPRMTKLQLVTGGEFDEVPDRPDATWTVSQFAMGLSRDAVVVLQLTLETPDDLADMLGSRADRPESVRAALKRYLANMGWASDRITESFSEIGEALKG